MANRRTHAHLLTVLFTQAVLFHFPPELFQYNTQLSPYNFQFFNGPITRCTISEKMNWSE